MGYQPRTSGKEIRTEQQGSPSERRNVEKIERTFFALLKKRGIWYEGLNLV